MKRFLYSFLFLIILITTSGCCNPNTQPNPSLQDRFKAKLVQHLEKSTVVLLQKDIEKGMYSSLCAGVWISQTRFISARHCPETEIISTIEAFLHIKPNLKELPGVIMPYKIYSEINERFKIADRKKPHFAVVIAYDPKNDLALFEATDPVEHDIVPLYQGDIYDGQNLLIVGHSAGMEYSVINGIVSKDYRLMEVFGEKWDTIQISAPVAGGNSGGGAFDLDGNLLGICSFTKAAPNQSFFVHRNIIVDFIKSVK